MQVDTVHRAALRSAGEKPERRRMRGNSVQQLYFRVSRLVSVVSFESCVTSSVAVRRATTANCDRDRGEASLSSIKAERGSLEG